MDIKTFEAIKTIATLAKKYDQKSEVLKGKEKEIYQKFVSELDELFDRTLRVGKHLETDESAGIGVMNQSVNGVSSYTKVERIRTYENGNSLVEDTSLELHLVPHNSVTIE